MNDPITAAAIKAMPRHIDEFDREAEAEGNAIRTQSMIVGPPIHVGRSRCKIIKTLPATVQVRDRRQRA